MGESKEVNFIVPESGAGHTKDEAGELARTSLEKWSGRLRARPRGVCTSA